MLYRTREIYFIKGNRTTFFFKLPSHFIILCSGNNIREIWNCFTLSNSHPGNLHLVSKYSGKPNNSVQSSKSSERKVISQDLFFDVSTWSFFKTFHMLKLRNQKKINRAYIFTDLSVLIGICKKYILLRARYKARKHSAKLNS